MENTVIDNLDPNQNENQVAQNELGVNEAKASEKKLRLNNLSPKQKNALLRGGSGLAAILLGTVAFSAMSLSKNKDENFENDELDISTNDFSDNIYTESVEITMEAPIASNITSDMSFSEAFEAAREEVGAGGFFMHNDSVYNTYYKEEWEQLSEDQKEDYVNSIADKVQTIEPVTIDTPSEPDTIVEETVSVNENIDVDEPNVSHDEKQSNVDTSNVDSTNLEESDIEIPNSPESVDISPKEDLGPEEEIDVPSDINQETDEEISSEEELYDVTNELEDLIFNSNNNTESQEVVELEKEEAHVDSDLLNQDGDVLQVEDELEVIEESNVVASTETIEAMVEDNNVLEIEEDEIEVEQDIDFVFNEESGELEFNDDAVRDYEELPSDMVSTTDDDTLEIDEITDIMLDDLEGDLATNDLDESTSSDDDLSYDDSDLF